MTMFSPDAATPARPRLARGPIAALLALSLFAAVAFPARADLVVQVRDSTAPIGGTGSFDVVLADTGGTYQVGGFGIQVSVPGASGVLFTSVDGNTDAVLAPYIFGTVQVPPLSLDSFPTNEFSALDSLAPGTVTLNAGDIFGLAHVTYSIDPTAAIGPVSVSLIANGTDVTDGAGNSLVPTLRGGTILITRAVPEPAAIAMMAQAAVFAGLAYRRARRRTA